MRRVGQSRRRDLNEACIVEALQAVGARVYRISGKGCPDLLAWYQGRPYVLEVKAPKGIKTRAQLDAPWPFVKTESEALAVIGVHV